MSWHTLAIDEKLSAREAVLLTRTCARLVTARVNSREEANTIEVLIKDQDDLDYLASMFRQALLDQRLRAEIENRYTDKIDAVVDNVLIRAASQK